MKFFSLVEKIKKIKERKESKTSERTAKRKPEAIFSPLRTCDEELSEHQKNIFVITKTRFAINKETGE